MTRGERRPSWPSSAPAVGGLCLLVAIVVNALLVHEAGDRSGDSPYYARMADHPAGPHTYPYALRVGVPYLVHALPFSHGFSWIALALLCGAAAGGGLFALLREFGVGSRLASVLAVGFTVSPPLLVEYLRNGVMVDAGAICVIVFGCLFIVRRQRLALAAALLLGATIHDSCMFLIPLSYAIWARRPLDRDALRDVALTAIVPLVMYIHLKGSIAAVGPRYQATSLHGLGAVLREALGHGGWWRELRRIALDFGPLWIAAGLALRFSGIARRGLVLLAVCVASTAFALDWGRALFFAAPMLYLAAALGVNERRRLARITVAGLLAMNLGYAVYMQVHGVRHGLDASGPTHGPPV